MAELVSKTDKEISAAIAAQKELCEKEKLPKFAPSNGKCWSCNRNVYQNYKIGERVSRGCSGETLVTGCPHCCRSYCD